MDEEKVNEEETRKKLESLESERKEKERKLAVVKEATNGEQLSILERKQAKQFFTYIFISSAEGN